MKAGEGRLLGRASTTILRVSKEMSLTKRLSLDLFAHEMTADVNVARKV